MRRESEVIFLVLLFLNSVLFAFKHGTQRSGTEVRGRGEKKGEINSWWCKTKRIYRPDWSMNKWEKSKVLQGRILRPHSPNMSLFSKRGPNTFFILIRLFTTFQIKHLDFRKKYQCAFIPKKPSFLSFNRPRFPSQISICRSSRSALNATADTLTITNLQIHQTIFSIHCIISSSTESVGRIIYCAAFTVIYASSQIIRLFLWCELERCLDETLRHKLKRHSIDQLTKKVIITAHLRDIVVAATMQGAIASSRCVFVLLRVLMGVFRRPEGGRDDGTTRAEGCFLFIPPLIL